MKLAHIDLECQLDFKKTDSWDWIIENPELLAKYVQELYIQVHGGEGKFVLSDNDKELQIDKTVEMIIDFFAVNINDRKILNKLYDELNQYAISDEMYLQTREIISTLQIYFSSLEQYNSFMLEQIPDIDVKDIFKLLGIKLASCSDDFFENILEYIKILAALMDKKLVIFVNLTTYLNMEQIVELIKTAAYNEIKLLFINSLHRDYLKNSSCYIIDKDGCEIF